MTTNQSKIIFDGRTVVHNDLTLTDDDRRFAEQLTRQQIIDIDELKQGVRFIAKWSWVGVVKFCNFELQIKPKLSGLDPDGDNLALAEILDFISDTHEVKTIRRLNTFDAVGTNLFDLILATFADACEEIVSKGILADYVEVEQQLPVLRGSLLMLKQLQSRPGRFDRLQCLHDEQTSNICENQILLAALLACSGKAKSQMLNAQIKRLAAIFGDAADVQKSTFDFEDVYEQLLQGGYNRLNSYYRHGHALAALIMKGIGYKNIFSTGEHRCFAFLFKMSEVFEKFVCKLLALQLSQFGYRVISQKEESRILWNLATDSSYASLRPDMLIENKAQAGTFLPVDAKYKNYDVRENFGDDIHLEDKNSGPDELAKKVSTQDIFQTFTYAHGFAHGQHASSPTSMIVYSSSSNDAVVRRISVRRSVDDSSSGSIIVVPINVKNELAALKEGRQTNIASQIAQVVKDVLSAQ